VALLAFGSSALPFSTGVALRTEDNLQLVYWLFNNRLATSTEIPEFKAINVSSPEQCKEMCCDHGNRCITWQYWSALGICKIGGPVRLGDEGGGHANWCEPIAPKEWKGQKLNGRDPDTKTCSWRTVELNTQCFGLGPERKVANGTDKIRILDPAMCGAECCRSPKCVIWQHREDKGCFYDDSNKADDYYCDPYKGTYVGGRKRQN
jgi:hypothetical protein